MTKTSKILATFCIWLCLGLGIVGLVLPLLPTTPFILLAAWIASKTSPKYHHWINNHPRFGPMIAAWREERAVPKSAKITACTLLSVSWIILYFSAMPRIGVYIMAAFFLMLATFILTRPSPKTRN